MGARNKIAALADLADELDALRVARNDLAHSFLFTLGLHDAKPDPNPAEDGPLFAHMPPHVQRQAELLAADAAEERRRRMQCDGR